MEQRRHLPFSPAAWNLNARCSRAGSGFEAEAGRSVVSGQEDQEVRDVHGEDTTPTPHISPLLSVHSLSDAAANVNGFPAAMVVFCGVRANAPARNAQ